MWEPWQGLPLAGLVAILALSKVTRAIHARVRKAGLQPSFDVQGVAEYFGDVGRPWHSQTSSGNVGIVDDDVFFAAVNPDEAEHPASRLATFVFEEYRRACLQSNLTPENTAVMFTWCGKGRNEAKT